MPQHASAAPTFNGALAVWARIGVLSFGGPAGQIALMHRVLVDARKWIGEQPFLHALNFCMLLPGPEAMQLATYVGWRLHGTLAVSLLGCCSCCPAPLSCSRSASAMRSTVKFPLSRRRLSASRRPFSSSSSRPC